MGELMIFEGNEVEVFDFEGQILFNPKHVGDCLEMNAAAVRYNLGQMDTDEVVKLKNSDVSSTHIRKLNNAGENFLTEAGVYALIFRSRKKEALNFQKWVTKEVLPQIRSTGGYIPLQEEDDELTIMAKAMQIMQNTLEKRDDIIKILQPKADFADTLLKSDRNIDVGVCAKILKEDGIKIGRNRLFKYLRTKQILMKDNIPYQRYIDGGYFQIKEDVCLATLQPSFKTLVTPEGQLYIHKKIKEDIRNGSFAA